MKSILTIIVSICILLFALPYNASSQDSIIVDRQVYFGFDSLGWKRISKRYERVQPRAELFLKNGETLSGQVLLLSDSNLVLYPGYEIVITQDQSKQFIYVDLNDIEKIKFKDKTKNYGGLIFGGLAGGFGGTMAGALILWGEGSFFTIIPFFVGGTAAGGFIGRKIHQRSGSYTFENDTTKKKDPLNSMKKWVVYKDTISYSNYFEDIVDHSKILKSAFPRNKVKLEFSIVPSGKGFNVKQNIEDVIGSGYPTHHTSYGYNFSNFSINSSIKITDKFHLGAGWFKGDINKTYFYYLADTLEYSMHPWGLRGFRIFGEYSLVPIDRYLTKKLEVQAGLGLLFARSNVRIRWNTYSPSGGIWNGGIMKLNNVKTLGVLGKVSANLYASPSFSFTAGIEGNFFRNLSVPALESLEMDYNWPAIEFPIPEYNINYTTIRFRIGAQFHF